MLDDSTSSPKRLHKLGKYPVLAGCCLLRLRPPHRLLLASLVVLDGIDVFQSSLRHLKLGLQILQLLHSNWLAWLILQLDDLVPHFVDLISEALVLPV